MPRRCLYTLPPPLSRHRRTFLSLPRSHRSGYLLRKDLHFQKENKSQHFSGGSSRRYQGGRRWHLAGDFYGLRSWLHRSRGKNPAAPKQPFWPKGVNYVFGPFCKGSVRTEQEIFWRRASESNPRYGFPHARLRGEYFQPLSHLSAVLWFILSERLLLGLRWVMHKMRRVLGRFWPGPQRRAAKNDCRREVASSESTPGVTSTW